MTTRYKLTVEYDGTDYAGWQRQAHSPSVQQSIEEAVRAYTGEQVTIFAAGRTDSGVHATGQVIHLDLERGDTADTVAKAINAHLRPQPIAIVAAEEVRSDFHARFDAHKRYYLYRILNRRAPPALDRNRVWCVHVPLDAEAMHDAAQLLVGKHDFTTFRAAACQAKSPIKTVDRIDVSRFGDEIHIEVEAPSFLHNQIRSFAGSLKLVGESKWSSDDLLSALNAKNRNACGPVAVPDGLYLTRVDYPE